MLCRLIRHVLAQPEVRKVEAGAPWAVGSAFRAWNFCGVHSVTKVENQSDVGHIRNFGKQMKHLILLKFMGEMGRS